MFIAGGMTEAAMTFSGFYSVYSVNEAKKKAQQDLTDERLLEYARRRRQQRQGNEFNTDIYI